MTDSERETCSSNGVESVTGVQIGNDGIVMGIGLDQEQFDVSRAEIWKALAAETVGPDGEIADNPYSMWSEINEEFPEQEIAVFGPPETSGTRDAFVELALEAGCEKFEAVTSLDEDRKAGVCTTLRSDGGFVEAGENDHVIVERVNSQPGAIGIFGYSYYEQNRSSITPLMVSGSEPTAEAIASTDYPLSRPLFIYVKDQHVGVIPNLKEFLTYYTSDEVWGPEGYLIEQGLIPMSDDLRTEVSDKIASMGGN